MSELKVEDIRISDVKPYPRNAKIHSKEQIDMIARSIEQFGFNNPILLSDNFEIIAGHGRFEAAKTLGMQEVPCIVLPHLNDEQRRAYILADNKLAELAEWDDAILDLELLNVESINMEDFGFVGFDEVAETDDKDEPSKEQKRIIESMELKAFEHWDYLVFVFKNQMDWLNACDAFKIGRVDAGYGDVKKVGVGRVVEGTRLLEAIKHQAADSKQKSE